METSRRQSLGHSESSAGQPPKSILKRESFIDVSEDLDRAMGSAASETPEQWFKRILASRQMSPLDLCDRFCFGGARKHRHVPLKHVCDVLFELEEPGYDPMSESMEEFLYHFSFDGGDAEIAVDIKEALRTLDIWKTTAPTRSPSKASALGSPKATVSPAKAAILEVKAEKLKKVIDSLQQENLRLSRALQGTEAANEARPPSPLRIAIKKPTMETEASGKPADDPPTKQQQPSPKIVSRHERDLIALADRLEYTGVKKLEEFLLKGDKTGSGFVSLKQLRWLLVDECRVGDDVSESKLMELCLGMNFNAQGLLDYKEFVRVLLDILIYESRPTRRSPIDRDKSSGLSEADKFLLTKTREYLRGFYGSREKNRELLELLCGKYDLEGNQSLSLTELTRIFQSDLANHHPAKLKAPLTQSETRRLLQCLSQASPERNSVASKSSSRESDAIFVHYPAVLDAILRDTSRCKPANVQTLLSRVLQPDFWSSLRSALCPHGDAHLERKIHTQLCKILMKLDRQQRFLIAQRHFVRVFDQHWSSQDIETLVQALSSPLDGRRQDESSLWVRYDVLMRLLFGAPELRDINALVAITKKLQKHRASWQNELMALMATNRHQQTLSYLQACELLCEDDSSLSVTEFLYLVAHVQDDKHHGDHRVDVHRLWKLLTTEEASSNGKTPDSSGKHRFLRRCLCVLADDHGLEKALDRRSRHERGVIRIDDVVRELCAQLCVLKLSLEEQQLVCEDSVQSFIRSLDPSDDFVSPGASLIYTHAVMDAIFDWDAMASSLRLPDRLLDVKKTLELFDWDRDGSIDADDLVKAWRHLTAPTQTEKHRHAGVSSSPLHDWEIRVLVRRFPAASSETRARRSAQGLGAIDYSRLLVCLLERQQHVAREQLQEAVLTLLQQACERVTQGKAHMTTFDLEKAFKQIDREGKGYFHAADLRAFVLSELKKASDNGSDVQTLLSYASQGPALESAMNVLVGERKHKTNGKKVMSLMRFQELMNHGFSHKPSRRRSRSRSRGREGESSPDGGDTTSADESDESRRGRSSQEHPIEGQITLLRNLELCVFEICKAFADSHGQISPATAYAHLNGTDISSKHSQRRPRSQSPVRSTRPPASPSSSLSSSYSSRRSSCTTPRSIAEPPSNAMDPLTASQLKLTLRSLHGVETSTHLIGQFFLRLGSSTKHFLELSLFAKWIAPLSLELQSRVKQIAREMVVKSKSRGGQLDLERFIAAVDRRLLDAQAAEDAMVRRSGDQRFADHHPMGLVRASVLLTRLHQLNVSVRKPEMAQLLRHFGMETQHEIDYAIFLRRLFELAQQLPQSGR